MNTRYEDEKKAAKQRYAELLAALNTTHIANNQKLFEMIPDQISFNKKYENNSVAPLYVEFKSKNTGNTFTIENKFYPHGWSMTIPERATKEEMNFIRDILLETVANPVGAHKDYTPSMIASFPENTPEEEIFEFIEAAQAKGIEVHLFIGEKAEFEQIGNDIKRKHKVLMAAGNYENPGWNGFINDYKNTEGGRKGEELMEKYNAENRSSFRCG